MDNAASAGDGLNIQRVNEHLYELYRPTGGPVQVEIIFFHGLQWGESSQAVLSTWTNEDNELWPATWLPQSLPQARILSVSYDVSMKKSAGLGKLDSYLVTENLNCDIGDALIGQTPGCPVILVGHCFGGLVIKDVCIQAHRAAQVHKYHPQKQKMTNFLNNLEGIFFYGTPHRGENFANLVSHLLHNPMREYVVSLTKAAPRLDIEFCCVCQKLVLGKKIASVGERNKTKIGKMLDAVMVSEGSARYGDYHHTLNADHFTICKPLTKRSPGFRIFLEFIRHVISEVI